MLVSKVSVFLFQINLTNHSEKNNNNKIIFMLNKAHSNICVALSNSTCCCFLLKVLKVYFPLPYCKKGGGGRGGGKLLFSEKIPSISTWLLPFHPHTLTIRTKRQKYPHLMKFYLHTFKLLEILRLNSVRPEIFVSRFWSISLIANH